MPADTSVKFLHSGMAGAPTLNGTAGTLIALLDACLVNGFAAAAVDSIAIAGNVATVTRAAGHPFEVGSVTQIADAVVSGGSINGQHRVTAITSSAYQFDVTGLADQIATGAPTHRLAPLGWEKPFSGTNLAVYRSPNVEGTRLFLRVDDTGTTSARVVGYETMSDVNTGTGPFPTSAQISGGGHWGKSQIADATAKGWVICGDDRGFVIHTNSISGASGWASYFGDVESVKSPDPYACLLACAAAAQTTSSQAGGDIFQYGFSFYSYIARPVTGVGSAVQTFRVPPFVSLGTTANTTLSGMQGAPYPNLGDGGLYVTRMNLSEQAPQVSFRGVAPGVFFVPQTVAQGTFAHREVVNGVVGLGGRQLRALSVGNGNGVGFVDATGPWR